MTTTPLAASSKFASFGTTYSNGTSNPARIIADSFDANFTNTEASQWAAEQTEGHCFFCGKDMVRDRSASVWHVKIGATDHLIPASRYGLRTKGNMALVCYKCNQHKDNMMPEDYWMVRTEDKLPVFHETLSAFRKALYDHLAPYRSSYPDQLYWALNLDAEWDNMVEWAQKALGLLLHRRPDLGNFSVKHTMGQNLREMRTQVHLRDMPRKKGMASKSGMVQTAIIKLFPTMTSFDELSYDELIKLSIELFKNVTDRMFREDLRAVLILCAELDQAPVAESFFTNLPSSQGLEELTGQLPLF